MPYKSIHMNVTQQYIEPGLIGAPGGAVEGANGGVAGVLTGAAIGCGSAIVMQAGSDAIEASGDDSWYSMYTIFDIPCVIL